MEESKEQNKLVIYIGAVIIALLLVGLVIAVSSNSKNKKNLNAEKLTSEKLLSEKLQVQKELDGVKTDFAALQQKNDANEKLLAETNKKIEENKRKINSLAGENRSLRESKKELEDLQKVKAEIEKESQQLKSDYDKLLAKSNDLQSSLAAMQAENNKLTAQLDSALLYKVDNYLLTATRGKTNQKIVASAMCTKKLNVAFDVPQNLTEAISFKIITPSGSTINPDDKSMSWYFVQEPTNYTASLSGYPGVLAATRQVVLTYAKKEKLAKGVYKIQILCKGNVIGNCRIQLK
jgi:myosin heavy subunit